MKKGKLWIALAVFWLVLAISFSTRAQQATQTESAEPQTPGQTASADQQAPEAGGQQPSTNLPAQAEPKPGEPKKKPQDRQGASGTSDNRLFWTLPNFLTLENAGRMPPLTAGQKFKVMARGAFDPFQLASYALLAGIGQAGDSEPGYGQGGLGYAKRYRAIFGDTTIENLMTGAILPSLLRQDPRYFQMGKGGFRRRMWYAVTRIVVIRGDSGRAQFNASEIFGSALSAGISTYAYHPHGDQKVSDVLSVWGTQVGLDAVGNMMSEFWPDVRRHFARKKGTPTPQTGKSREPIS